ncbi:hypothetical protein BKP35_15705 [Anaerobacillus arseniciselenatis]|uniref:Uncharacterized protein n=1 Tax=Anaerobacillus arseniciselenatis TaxID=85682 RepID=A0A1S2LC42_9BACI|nr:hypothetical protein [Anaerobacillus arseniciselenatis]OIJ09926.1 hypothetical protein BKP35_15705 [Anaerobacillus arseniciselenatis]
MFIGSWIINFFFSITAFLLVFIGSMTTNTVLTSFIRACFTFVSFYLITYFFRWIWMIASKDTKGMQIQKSEIEAKDDGKATNNKVEYTEVDIEKATNYVKDLIND